MKILQKVDKPTLIIGLFWCIGIPTGAFFNSRTQLTMWDIIILVIFTAVVGLAFYFKAKLKLEEEE